MLEACSIETKLTEQAPGTILSADDRGLVVAALHNRSVCVRVIYIEEGFLMAKRLKEFGAVPGARFDLV